MNRLSNGSVIIVIHVTLILHSRIRPHPWSCLPAVVSSNPSSVFFENMQKQAMSVHQTVCVCVCGGWGCLCVCVSHSLFLFPHFMLWTNEWLSRSLVSPNGEHHTKLGISQWRTPHFLSCWIHPAVLETSKDIFTSSGMAWLLVIGMSLKDCKNGNMVRLILVKSQSTYKNTNIQYQLAAQHLHPIS